MKLKLTEKKLREMIKEVIKEDFFFDNSEVWSEDEHGGEDSDDDEVNLENMKADLMPILDDCYLLRGGSFELEKIEELTNNIKSALRIVSDLSRG